MGYCQPLNIWNFETAIDDFVFLNFFVGNDFIPHLPCMQIRDGAIDVIIMVWKTVVQKANGFMTHQGQIVLPNLKLFLSTIAKIEFLLFKEKQSKMAYLEGKKNDNINIDNQRGKRKRENMDDTKEIENDNGKRVNFNKQTSSDNNNVVINETNKTNNKTEMDSQENEELKEDEKITKLEENEHSKVCQIVNSKKFMKEVSKSIREMGKDAGTDQVRLHEDG